MFDDLFLTIPLSYAIGCVSFAGLVARLKRVDIRAHGSGNPGATNVGRVIGPWWGRLVLLLDVLKGLLPVLWLRAPLAAPGWVSDADGRVLIAAAAVLGHVYPITAGFRGGKGVATLVGGMLALDPLLALIAVAVHLVVKRGLGFVSIASVALAWAFPAAQLVCRALGSEEQLTDGVVATTALALLVTVRHGDNFRRLREGTEDRVDGSFPETPGSSS